MRMENAAVGKMNELMLPATLDARDGRIAQRTRTRWRKPPPQRRMQHANLSNDFSIDRFTETTNRGLDFRELGHRMMGAVDRCFAS